MLKKILLAAAIAVGVFAVYIAVLPADYSVSRSIVIAAPPEQVFQQVNDLRRWEDWSPWLQRDPNSKNSYRGPVSGKGAIFMWDGNEDVGKGQMTIEESLPPSEIEIRLDFMSPYRGTADSGFAFDPVEGGTRVTWSFAGEQNYVERAVFTLMGLEMDQMIGKDYELGLANLKRVVETGA